jgi:hypothetical protein
MRRLILWVIAILTLGNGASMVLAPEAWWSAVPGAQETGAFNAHFVRDVGAAYLAAGLGIGWFALRAAERAAAIVGLVFLGLHAVFHLIEFGYGHGGGMAAVLGVIAPALIAALAVLWPPSVTGEA